jgi:hypothetical protein
VIICSTFKSRVGALVTVTLGAISCAAPMMDDEYEALDEVGVLGEALTQQAAPEVSGTATLGCPGIATIGRRKKAAKAGRTDSSGDQIVEPIRFGADYDSLLVNLDGHGERKTECTAQYDLTSPQGAQYRLGSIAHNGHATLSPQVKARHVSISRLGGLPEKSKDVSVANDAIDSDYNFVNPGSDEWTRCGLKEKLKVTTRLVLKGAKNAASSSIEEFGFEGQIEARSCKIK